MTTSMDKISSEVIPLFSCESIVKSSGIHFWEILKVRTTVMELVTIPLVRCVLTEF